MEKNEADRDWGGWRYFPQKERLTTMSCLFATLFRGENMRLWEWEKLYEGTRGEENDFEFRTSAQSSVFFRERKIVEKKPYSRSCLAKERNKKWKKIKAKVPPSPPDRIFQNYRVTKHILSTVKASINGFCEIRIIVKCSVGIVSCEIPSCLSCRRS